MSTKTKHCNLLKSNKIIPQLIRRQIILANIYKNLTGNSDKTVVIADICDFYSLINITC